MKRWLLFLASPTWLERVGLWMIVGGLIAEALLIVDALTIESLPSKLDKPLSAIFTVAIALGVWIEHVGAEAIKSRERAPRHLERKQWAALIKTLRFFAPQQFDVAALTSDPEAINFGREIESNLRSAGWRQLDWKSGGGGLQQAFQPSGSPLWGIVTIEGVLIAVHPERASELFPIGKELMDGLIDAGIDARAEPASGGKNANVAAIHILIGKKP